MDCSIEMKIQALDRMIEMRKQLITMQDNLGVYNSLSEDTFVLIYRTENFFEIANELKANVESGPTTKEGDIILSFYYKDTKFSTFILPKEYELLKHEIDRGESDD
ncbi:MAG: hypothetical protein ACI4ES_12315 [Roseburia sp.]